MIGICEDNLCAEFFEGFLSERLDGCLGANGQEERRLNNAVRSAEAAAAGLVMRLDRRVTQPYTPASARVARPR